MTVKKIPTRFCDVEKCKEKAEHSCAICDCDMCNSEHTHYLADGGHIEHSVRLTACPFSYGGDIELYLCPKCYVETGFWKLFDEKGKHTKDT